MSTVADLIASINELPADERAAFVTAFQNDGGDVVKAVRSKVFAAGKREGASSGSEAATKLADAEQRVADLEAELADVKAKTPDTAAIVDAERKRWEPKVQKAEAEREAAKQALRGSLEKVALAKLRAALTAEQPDGTRVDPNDADDEYVQRYAKYVVIGDDGTQDIRQFGGEGSYDAPDADAKIALLAADVRKQIAATKPRWILTNTDTGGGIGSGGGYGRTGGVATVDAIVAQKAHEYSL